MAVRALVDAADEDRGTGGVDAKRGIYPTVMICTKDGIDEVDTDRIQQVHQDVLTARGTAG